MLFVKALKLCTTVLLFTQHTKAAEDDSSQSEYSEEAGSLLKFITENASSAALMKEIAEAFEKEEADTNQEEAKKALRWGDAYEMTEPSTTSRSPPFVTDKPKTNAKLGENNQHDVYPSSNDVLNKINGMFHPPPPPPPEKDAVQNYVDHVLTHQNVPVLLLHVSLSGLQQKQNSLLVSFPVNVNLNSDRKEVGDNNNWNKEWNLNTQVDMSRPIMPLRSARGESAEKDIEIAKSIKDKILKSKPGYLLFTDLDKTNKTEYQ